MPATLGRQQRIERPVVDITKARIALLPGGEVTEVGAQGPVAQGLAVLQAHEALLIDIFEAPVPEAGGGAIGVEAVVATGIVEGIAVGLALGQVAEHGDHFLVAGFVAQAG
ncbi:hypothetical protein D9M71_818090 [compost metagenome]